MAGGAFGMGYTPMLLFKLGQPDTAQTAGLQPPGVSLGSSERGPETQLFCQLPR